MDIKTTSSGLPSPLLDALRRNAAAQQRTAVTASPPVDTTHFSSALQHALQSVSASQREATRLADAFQADPSQVSLEQSMVAMQKAQIGFQSALHVRNRLVSAYSDIMNMQV